MDNRQISIDALRAAGVLACPDTLPIAERVDEIVEAIRTHQVLVVAGETGSGKSTQLPKLCLLAGRGTTGLIGHTQPRRVAARTIAERVADELGADLGTTVGYSVRFTDRVSDQTLVKVMTDGILLAEIQRDRMLRKYDTIIIDEAHERSLNIDFLLGYLKQLLPQRPDLHLIITSATIDTQRFSEHFGAPIIEVSGRTYPVEMRYRPLDADTDQVQGVIEAVDELSREGNGDVLVFLSGEREIHDTADALRRHAQQYGSSLEVLPLYARLSAVEQHRIFEPHRGRRVVLSTNVAETSLTVPGVRYVVDAGTARVSRYSHRLKVQRLPIEPVSQASANQRAGRCGRVAPGVCIRLYDEDDFAAREAFTEPEILRTSLASVILQMASLRLGDVLEFPFIDPPDPRAVRDGYALLEELGAIDTRRDTPHLTRLGRELARLPIDPRLGRMVLEADRHGCVREVMVIAAALSIQDVRERPAEHRQAADEHHRRFDVPGSDFLSLVKLWDHLREQQQQLTGNQFRKMCRTEYLNYLRVREWQDLFSQIRQIGGQIGIRQGTEAGHPDRVHQALLAGLLSHIGVRDSATEQKRGPAEYKGAHGSRFAIGTGSVLSKAQPKWVMAAELVETNRLWGRMTATIQPEWAERLAPHLLKRVYGDPVWDPRRGGAVCTEQVSLFGLPLVRRTIGYDRIDLEVAREWFIRCALVEGDWTTHHTFWEHNRAFLADLAGMGQRARRVDLIDADAVFAFYDRRVGAEVCTTRHFDRWWRDAKGRDPELLTMRIDDFVTTDGAFSPHDFPGEWIHGEHRFEVQYRFDPSAHDDGATVIVPLTVLHQLTTEGFDWQVPGFRDELIEVLLRGLPKDVRRELTPMADVVQTVCRTIRTRLDLTAGSLAQALSVVLADTLSVKVSGSAFDSITIPRHLRLHYCAIDDEGVVLGIGDDLPALQRALATRVRAEVARQITRQTGVEERKGITAWDFGDLPHEITTERNGVVVRGYPALLDDDDSVSIRVFTNPDLQQRVMRIGVRRLLLLTVPVSKRAIEQHLTNASRLAVAGVGVMPLEHFEVECLQIAADRVIDDHGGPTWTEADFTELVERARDELAAHAAHALRAAADACEAAHQVQLKLDRLQTEHVAASATDATNHLARLIRPGFIVAAGMQRIDDIARYIRAIDVRLAKVPKSPTKDLLKLRDLLALERDYSNLLRSTRREDVTTEMVDLGWQLEELRVATFAQQLGVKGGASTAKVSKALQRLTR